MQTRYRHSPAVILLFRLLIISVAGVMLFMPAMAAGLTPYQHLPATEQVRWQALIHSVNGVKIDDPAFLLSHNAFSPTAEWQASYRLLKENPAARCRFPARYRFIRPYSDLPEFRPAIQCPDYARFLQQVPSDQLSLIHISSDVRNPITMMGHVMLAMSGTDTEESGAEAEDAQYSVSFSVELDDLNLLRAGWQTLVSGKPGYFQLAPLAEHIGYYRQQEQRHVRRYRLNSQEQTQALIRDHIWELQQTRLDYLFHRHNCATVIADILRLSQPGLETSFWTSPQDVVQAVHRHRMVRESALYPAIDLPAPSPTPDPLQRHHDSQLTLGLEHTSDNTLTLQWLPADHSLQDLRPGTPRETELKLATATIAHTPATGKTELQQLELYAVTALSPARNELSGRLQLGYRPFYNPRLETEKNGYLEAGIGKSYRPVSPLTLYALLNVGYRPMHQADDLYLRPQAGGYLYSSDRMKTGLTLSALRLEQSLWQRQLELSHTIDFRTQALILDYRQTRLNNQQQEIMGLRWRFYF